MQFFASRNGRNFQGVMLNFSRIFFIQGTILMVFSFLMLIPYGFSLLFLSSAHQGFLFSGLVTFFVSGILLLSSFRRFQAHQFSLYDGVFLIVGISITLPFFGALPFALSGLELSWVDYFFESTSGLTTTGASIFEDLDQTNKAVLLWRGILQWIGGIGIVIVALLLLPALSLGGMQLFRLQSIEGIDKPYARIRDISKSICVVYGILTLLCVLFLKLGGMSSFDAIVHAMTTVATGGFSNHNASIGHFSSGFIESVIVVFMVLASLPFVLYIYSFTRPVFFFQVLRSEQVKFFLMLVVVCSLGVSGFLFSRIEGINFLSCLRLGFFNTVSVLTGTGYSSTDYSLWPPLILLLFFILTFCGGCAGSTTCGVKIFRLHILLKSMVVQGWFLLSPTSVRKVHYDKKIIEAKTIDSIISFFLIFLLSWLVLFFCLSLTGLDFLSAASAASASIANLGPGLGYMGGPTGSYSEFTQVAKWSMCLGMIAGRLEIYPLFALFAHTLSWRGR